MAALILYQSPPKKYTWKSFQSFYKILNPTCHLRLIWWGILLYWFFAQLFKSGMQGRRKLSIQEIAEKPSPQLKVFEGNLTTTTTTSTCICILKFPIQHATWGWSRTNDPAKSILVMLFCQLFKHYQSGILLQQDRYFSRSFVLDKPKMACWIGKFTKGACMMHSWCCRITLKVLLWDDFSWRQQEIAERNHHLHNNTLPKPYWSSIKHTASKENKGILWKEMMLGNGGRWRERRSMCYWPFT
jgi:hypothetical protein